MKEKFKENIQKLPRLTKEEMAFFKKKNNDFFKKYNLDWKIPLHKRMADALQTLAVAKFVGVGYHGITIKDEKEAIEHHLKACTYDPTIAFRASIFRKNTGLPIYKDFSSSRPARA